MAVDDSVRDDLEAGKPVTFPADRPREDRIVPARWIERGVAASGRLNIAGVIVNEPINFSNVSVAGQVMIQDCVLEGGLSIEYCSFANLFNLTRTTVRGDLLLNASRFGSDVGLISVRLFGASWRALAIFDCSFDGVFHTDRFRVYSGHSIVIERTAFRSDLWLSGCLLTGNLAMAGVSVGRDVLLSRAFIGGWLDLSKALVFGAVAVGGIRLRGMFAGLAVSVGRVEGARARCGGRVELREASIKGSLDFDQAQLGGGVGLEAARVGGTVSLRSTRMDGQCTLTDAIIDGNVRLSSAKCLAITAVRVSVRGEVDMNFIQMQGGMKFREAKLATVSMEGARVSGEIDFYSALMRSLICSGARFNDQRAVFDLSGATLSGQLYMDGAWFRCKCEFIGLRIEQQVSATMCVFFGGLNFYEGYVGRGAFFWFTLHQRAADFTSLTVVGEFYLSGSRFREIVTVDLARLGTCRIETADNPTKLARPPRQVSRFRRDFKMRGTQVLGVFNIRNAEFRGGIDFQKSTFIDFFAVPSPGSALTIDDVARINFDGCRFQGTLELGLNGGSTGISFRDAFFAREVTMDCVLHSLSFEAAVCDNFFRLRGDIHDSLNLTDARLTGLDLTELRVGSSLRLSRAALKILLLPEGSLGVRSVAVDGCVYDRVQGNWKALFHCMTAGDYERGPYAQLERTLRRQGDDEAADFGYFLGRKHERSQYRRRRQYGRLLMGWVYGVLFGWGARTWPAFCLAAVLVLGGAMFFRLPQAIKPRPGLNYALPTPGLADAVGVSINQVLPVQTILAAEWVPSDKPVPIAGFSTRPDVIATVMKLIGLILIPMIIASVSGLLRRTPRS